MPESQSRQRPLNNKKPSRGMLCHQRIGLPHSRQCEGGLTIDSSRGIRVMQTLRKLPKTSPATNSTLSKSRFNEDSVTGRAFRPRVHGMKAGHHPKRSYKPARAAFRQPSSAAPDSPAAPPAEVSPSPSHSHDEQERRSRQRSGRPHVPSNLRGRLQGRRK